MSRNIFFKEVKQKSKKVSFEDKKNGYDNSIKDLSVKINREHNYAIKSLFISKKNDIVISKNDFLKNAYSRPNYVKKMFNSINKEIISQNQDVFKKNLKVRENNPNFVRLENSMGHQPKSILNEMASKLQMTEALYEVKELICY